MSKIDEKSQLKKRKDEHLDICLQQDVSSNRSSVFEKYRLEYDAFPDVNLQDIDLRVSLLGKELQAPLLIGSMTGGSERAGEINHKIAKVASQLGLGMALGSQRAMLKHPETERTFQIRQSSPDLPLLLANIGAIQLNEGVGISDLEKIVSVVDADALYLHFNPLQEALQPEGDTRFQGLFARLQELLPQLPFPCLAKEVGAGFSSKTAQKLASLPFAGVEASGVGGTSWARVEGYRSSQESVLSVLGERLKGFGVPTDESIANCRNCFPDRVVIASGGIRTGEDIAKALLLGADAVAIAQPVLEAIHESENALEHYLTGLLQELRILCFCTGSCNISALKKTTLLKKA